MPRVYKKPLGTRPYKNYTEQSLKEAIDLVRRSKFSVKKAAELKLIPRKTLANKIKHLHSRNVGAPILLRPEIERSLVDVIIACADFGSPLTLLDVRFIVKYYLDKEGLKIVKFKDNLPGVDWGRSFLLRHKNLLSERHCQNIKRARAEKTEDEFEAYFKNLEEAIKDVPPDRILNYDETNLSDNPGSAKHVFRRGTKYPERIMNNTKSAISIMYAVTASGQILPPYVVYKAERLYDQWCISGPQGTRYNRSKSGWFDGPCFSNWFETIAIPWAKSLPGTKVLIGDNLSSHINLNVLLNCQRHNIKFIFLPSNSTHITQPLDISFFRPLKQAWREILSQYKLKNPRDCVLNKTTFPTLLNVLMEKIKINEVKNIKSGFKKAGIYPLDKYSVLKSLPKQKVVDIAEKIGATVINYLRETRSPSETLVKKRKTMIRVEPGKSLSAEDVEKAQNEKKKRKVKGNISIEMQTKPGPSVERESPTNYKTAEDTEKIGESETDLEAESNASDKNNENIYHDEVLPFLSNHSDPNDVDMVADSGTTLIEKIVVSPNIGSFAVIGLKTKKSIRYYVGKIIDKTGDYYEVTFLRFKYGYKFVFPNITDNSHITADEIIRALPAPTQISSSRDIFMFSVDLSEFKFS